MKVKYLSFNDALQRLESTPPEQRTEEDEVMISALREIVNETSTHELGTSSFIPGLVETSARMSLDSKLAALKALPSTPEISEKIHWLQKIIDSRRAAPRRLRTMRTSGILETELLNLQSHGNESKIIEKVENYLVSTSSRASPEKQLAAVKSQQAKAPSPENEAKIAWLEKVVQARRKAPRKKVTTKGDLTSRASVSLEKKLAELKLRPRSAENDARIAWLEKITSQRKIARTRIS